MKIVERLGNLENKVFIITALKILKEKNIIDHKILGYFVSKEFCNSNYEMHFPILREIKEGMTNEGTKEIYTDSKGYGR